MPSNIYKSYFKPSKYIDLYFRIISNPNRLNESYTEKHHILPKSIWPEFKKDQKRTYQNGRTFAAAKKIAIKCQTGKTVSDSTKAKISTSRKALKLEGKNSPLYGRILTSEHIKNISAALLGIPRTEETKAKISIAKKGKYLGADSSMFGKTHSDETKAKMSKASIGRPKSKAAIAKMIASKTGIKQKRIQCTHCHKIGGISAMTRHHGENCRLFRQH